jgi:hypothetical protein
MEQGARVALGQQSLQTIETFGAEADDGDRVRARRLARLRSRSQFIILDALKN